MQRRITLLLLCWIPLCLFAQQKDHFYQQIQKILYYDLDHDYDQTPGFLIGIITGDSTHRYSFGNLDSTDGRFEVGEITQLFTAQLVLHLTDAGVLHLDTAIGTYLPLDNYPPSITIKDCLQHTSGLPKKPKNFGDYEFSNEQPYANYPKEAILDYFSTFQAAKFKAGYQFSNLNYALLEMAIESHMQQNFEDILLEYVVQPIGLIATNLEADSLISPGFNSAGKTAAIQEYASFLGSLGLKSDLKDLLRFLRHQMENSGELEAAAIPTQIRKEVLAGYGWHLIRHKRYHSVWVHTGSTAGHRAYLAMVPESQTGVVVLSNAPFGMGGLGYLILRMLNNDWKLKRRHGKKE